MTKPIGIVAVFLAGCAVGGVSSQLVVPRASAQQAATLAKWEMNCVDVGISGQAALITLGNKLGAEAWEPAFTDDHMWCFKRPKM